MASRKNRVARIKGVNLEAKVLHEVNYLYLPVISGLFFAYSETEVISGGKTTVKYNFVLSKTEKNYLKRAVQNKFKKIFPG